MQYLLLLLMTACAFDPETDQKLVMDKNIQPMGRNEVIDAIKQCEKNGLRAITIYGKRKINGYTAETLVDVTCGPKFY
jgi:hypothetical protein